MTSPGRLSPGGRHGGLLALRLGVIALLRGALLRLVQLAFDAIFHLFGLLCLLHFSGGARSCCHGSTRQPAARAQGGGEQGKYDANHGGLLAHFAHFARGLRPSARYGVSFLKDRYESLYSGPD
jgi:hypothetical protein